MIKQRRHDVNRKAGLFDLEKQVNVVLLLREVGNGIVEFAFLDPDGHMIVILGRLKEERKAGGVSASLHE